MGRRGPRPEERAGRAGQPGAGICEIDRRRHGVADAGVAALVEGRPRQGHHGNLAAAGQEILAEQRHRLGAQEAHAIERAAAEQHPAKAQVVGRRRHQAAAAGFEVRRRRVGSGLRVVLKGQGTLGIGPITGGEALHLVRWAVEAGVGHAERREDALIQEAAERHARDRLDEIAEHVDGNGVVPRLARREEQRQFRQLRDHGVQPALGRHAGNGEVRVGLLDRAAGRRAVGEAGRMDQQIDDPHRRLERRRLEGAALATGIGAEIGEGRNQLGDRLVEVDPRLLHQHEDRHRHHRLGHGIDAENRVGAHRFAALQVNRPRHAGVDQFAGAPHLHEHAGDQPRRHERLVENAVNGLQPGHGHSGAISVGHRTFLPPRRLVGGVELVEAQVAAAGRSLEKTMRLLNGSTTITSRVPHGRSSMPGRLYL